MRVQPGYLQGRAGPQAGVRSGLGGSASGFFACSFLFFSVLFKGLRKLKLENGTHGATSEGLFSKNYVKLCKIM